MGIWLGLFLRNVGGFRYDTWLADHDGMLILKLLESNEVNEWLSGKYCGRSNSNYFKAISSLSHWETEDTIKHLNEDILRANRAWISLRHEYSSIKPTRSRVKHYLLIWLGFSCVSCKLSHRFPWCSPDISNSITLKNISSDVTTLWSNETLQIWCYSCSFGSLQLHHA